MEKLPWTALFTLGSKTMRANQILPGVLPTQRGLYYGGDWHAPKAGV